MIYHYTNEYGLKGILKSKHLWLVSSEEMNDKTDRFYGNLLSTIALFQSKDKDVKLLKDNLKPEDILNANTKSLDVKFYSASFCKKNDNDYLWNNYADSNRGICLEINDNILNNYFSKVVKEKFSNLEGDSDNITSNDTYINLRNVLYGFPIEDFNKIVKSLKPEDYVLQNNKDAYTNWFYSTVCILAGIVKGKNFEKECEIRLLFQDRYSYDYLEKNPLSYLFREQNEDIFLVLGIDTEIKDKKKRRMELKLNDIFNSELIPKIIIGDCYVGKISNLKKYLQTAKLTDTKIFNRNGDEL